MNWLDKLVHGFILTFGVVPPAEVKRAFADVCIAGLLLVMVLGGLAM
jgi:hypothetical protein